MPSLHENVADKSSDAAERTGEEVKQGWFSWLRWGKSKAEDKKSEGTDIKKQSEKRA